MDLVRQRLLLAGWWCAAVLPGLSMALLFPDDVLDGTGPVFGVWIAGYVAQIVLFVGVSRRVRGVTTTVVLWLLAAVLPFGVDWGLGIGWWAVVACVLATTAVGAFVALLLSRAAALQRNGIRATARVLEVKEPRMNVVVNEVYIKRKLRVRIKRDDGAPSYEAWYDDLFMLGDLPRPGDSFRVVVDPKRPQRLEAVDESVRRPAGERGGVARAGGSGSSGQWQFTSWRGKAHATPPGRPKASARAAEQHYRPYEPPTGSGSGSGSGRDLTGSLRTLAELHEQGQLTDEEFAIAKRELLSGEDSASAE